MTFNTDTDGWPYIVFTWLLFGLVTVLVPVRLYVQLRYYHRPWREVFVVLAWFMYLGLSIGLSLMNDWDWNNLDVMLESGNYSARAYKAATFVGLVYTQILYACKAALLCLYKDLVTYQTSPGMWWAVVTTGVIVTGASMNDLICGLYSMVHTTTSNNFRPWTVSVYWIHFATDVIVYILPFPILWGHLFGSLTRGQRIGLYAMFALGALNILNALVFVLSYAVLSTDYIFWVVNQFLYPFQAATGIIIICLPYCRRLYVDVVSREKGVADEESLALSTLTKQSSPDVEKRTVTVTCSVRSAEARCEGNLSYCK